eukprot:6469069-Amphidinium_carterae.1
MGDISRKRSWRDALGEQGSPSAGQSFSQEQAQKDLLEFLMKMHDSGRMTAKTVCTVAHFCEQAGLASLSCLAVAPTSSTGNFQRRVDDYADRQQGRKQFPIDTLSMPLTKGNKRIVADVPCLPPHTLLSALPSSKLRELQDSLRTASSSGQLPPVYTQHPVNRDLSSDKYRHIPMALYLDGLQFNRRDSILGVTVSPVMDKTKYLVFVLRCG